MIKVRVQRERPSLHTRHKDRAEQRERELKEVCRLQSEGLPVPAHLFGAPSRSVAEYLEDYKGSLTSRDYKAKHIHDTVTRIEKLCSACQWLELEDISPITFERWRSGVPTCERTGLRKNELATLRWGDINFEAAEPCLVVRPSVSKNRKNQPVSIIDRVLRQLHSMRPENWKPEGHSQSQPAAKSGLVEIVEAAVSKAISRALAPIVTHGHIPLNGCPV